MANDNSERLKIVNELDKNLLVSASAGSGKTTILVERMVALVESGKVDLSKMAALTFTKKAAGEFYERFYRKLQLRIKPSFNIKTDDKYSCLENPTSEAVNRDKEALKHVDTCFFGTIDAFYQKILNEHPFEAGLTSSATIIDDEEFNNYLLHKFNELIKSDNQKIREGAEFFNNLLGAKAFGSIMNETLSHKDLEIDQIDVPFETLKKEYEELLLPFKKGIEQLVKFQDRFITTTNKKNTGITELTEKWKALLDNYKSIVSLNEDDYCSAFWALMKIKNILIKEDEDKILPYDDFYNVFFTQSLTKCGKCRGAELNSIIYDALDKVIYSKAISFLSLVRDQIYDEMIDKGLLTFSLATDCLLKLLRNEKEYKSTIDDIRSKIDTLLIDECQDTDIKQYEIFFRLTANDYNEKFEKLSIDGGKLYACGDRKQGIYHFRGADVSTYDYIKKIFEEKKKSGLPFDLILLSDNHRSKGKLIQYFNNTFKEVLKDQGYPQILNDEIKAGEEHFGVFTYDTDKNRDSENVANIILDFVYNHGYSYKDFMVITSAKDKITKYAKSFAQYSIPCYCEGKIDVHLTTLLNVVISLFKYLVSEKKDKIAYYELLSSSLCKFDPTKSISPKIDYLSFLKEVNIYNESPSTLLEKLTGNNKILEVINCQGIDILIGIIQILKEKENNGEITSFIDAINFLSKFQEEDSGVERISLLSGDIDAVQIANVHKTKGLEKKIVILTYCQNPNFSAGNIVADKFYLVNYKKSSKSAVILHNPLESQNPLLDLIDKESNYEKEENQRLLYVAATRAKDYLFISNIKVKDGGRYGKNKWGPLLVGIHPDEPDYTIGEVKNREIKEVSLNMPTNQAIEDYQRHNKAYKIVVPSKSEEVETLHGSLGVEGKKDDALIYGTMVHKLMEVIIKNKDKKLDESICSYLGKTYNREDLVSDLKRVMDTIYSGGFKENNKDYSDILELSKLGKTYTETPFSYKDNDEVVSGNIDLIIEKDNEVLIVDYKTDTYEVSHQSQLDLYIKALEKSGNFKGKNINAVIYYVR